MRTSFEVVSASRLQEVRAEIRSHTDLEATILGRIAELPEDDFCHHSRESFQYGVGYAYMHVDAAPGSEVFTEDGFQTLRIRPDIITAFFHTRPKNKYLPIDIQTRYRETLEGLAIRICHGESVQPPDWIDCYELAAFLSFIDGYQLVANSVTHNQH